ncbi:hypothetical protein FRC12_000281 [Ceratobasidium sp. 428]|nr:hypothetical protein FRC12_000281 [Ceratobasidium sp. 428]
MPKKQTTKRVLENPGDVSISVAPAPAKKAKAKAQEVAPTNTAQPVVPTNTKTRSATKQVKTSNADTNINADEGGNPSPPSMPPTPADADAPKRQPRPKMKAVPATEESEGGDAPTVPTTKATKQTPPENAAKTAKGKAVVSDPAVNPAPAPAPKAKKLKPPKAAITVAVPASVPEGSEPTELTSPTKKSNRAKKPSEIAEKVQQQLATQKNDKDAKAAKKQKKAEAAVVHETVEETAAFLASLEGEANPPMPSPIVASPKRQRKKVNRTKAMDQLVNAVHIPSPALSLVSGASGATETSTRMSSIGPDDSISQINAPQGQTHLQVPGSRLASRDVSPAPPPPPCFHSSVASSRDEAPSAKSAVGDDDDDYDEAADISMVNIPELLSGIPPPWNVGPVPVAPDDLPAPYHFAKLDDASALKFAKPTKPGKDKSKAPHASINHFRVQDQPHLKLSLEYMDAFVCTIDAFPDEETRWAFASYANYLSSKYHGVSYRLTRESEHYRLLTSRISQTRGKFVTSAISHGVRGFYRNVNWDLGEDNQIEAVKALRERVAQMIKSSEFLAPADKPGLYYQHAWFGQVLNTICWATAGASKGFSENLTQWFSGISLPLYALSVTAGVHHLTVASSGVIAAATANRKAVNKFSHKTFKQIFESHLLTLVRLYKSESAHDGLTGHITELYTSMTGSRPTASPGSGQVRLAIPMAAFDNYGAEPRRRATIQEETTAHAASSRPNEPNTPGLTSEILRHPGLSAEAKVKIMEMICAASAEAIAPSQTLSNSARSAQQFQGLWTEVGGESDDSEVQARRAGVLPDTRGRPGPFAEAEAKESDEEMVDREGDGGGESDNGDGDGDGDGEAKPEADVEADVDANTGVESRDDSMVVLEEGAGDEEADVGDESGNEHEPSKSLERPFFTAEGGLAPGDSTSEEEEEEEEEEEGEEEESDGEGASGGVETGADADKTMMTAADEDEDD